MGRSLASGRRSLAVLVAAALVCTPAALAYRQKPDAADQATARNALLKRSDLPSTVTWKGGSVKPDNSSLSCAGYRPRSSDLVQTADAKSRYTAPGIMVESEVGLLATPRMVTLDAKRVFVPALIPCLRKTLARKVEVISVEQLPFPKLAQFAQAYRVVYQVEVKGKPVRLILDTVDLGSGRTEAQLTVLASLPPDEATGEADATILDEHLSQVLSARAFPGSRGPVA